jgi:subtilisin family serine protease
MTRRHLLVLLAVVSLALASGSRPSVAQGQSDGPQFVPSEVIVKFRYGATAAEKGRALARANAQAIDRLSRTPAAAAGGDVELARVGGGLNVAQAIARIGADASVVFAEPNWIYTFGQSEGDQTFPTDPSFEQLWGLHNTGQTINGYTDTTPDADIDAPEAWALAGTGSSLVVVGVIDEGIDFNHPDLAGVIWTNPTDVANGIDDDGNGYVDDVHGWDFANNDNTIYDGKPRTSVDAHGTHVTGTIGANANNAMGVAGVNWNVTVISAKFLGRNGGTTANAVKAVDYITDLKSRHNLNLVATNNSWGGGGFSQALLEAIARGANADILFNAAAGNGDRSGNGINLDVFPQYPASYSTTGVQGATYDAVVAVAATGRSDEIRPWSNYGATSVDLGAPGSLILSTIPGGKYDYYNGTSMATPHVSGVEALVNSSLALVGEGLKARILATVDPVDALTGKTVTGGRLNARLAVTPPPPVTP